MARSPEALWKLFHAIDEVFPDAEMSGIVGDASHVYGYHCARRDLPSNDYSVLLDRDRHGRSDMASALDIKFPADHMKLVTRRLWEAAKARDPRLHGLREFCGTMNGTQTFPWDLAQNRSEGLDSWDDSHLWHVHLSVYRDSADHWPALAGIVDVIAGKPLYHPGPAPLPHTYTVRSGDTLGAIATKYHTTWQKLAAINHIVHPDRLDVGQKIRVA